MTTRDRYVEAMRQTVEAAAAAIAEVDAVAPLPRYPLRRRIVWRLRGVPAEVRAEQRSYRETRAKLLLAALQLRDRSLS